MEIDFKKLAKENISYDPATNILQYKEVEHMSAPQVEAFAQYIEEVLAGRDNFFYLLDISQTKRPSFKLRKTLAKRYLPFLFRARSAAIIVGQRPVLGFSAKIIIRAAGVDDIETFTSKKSALSYLITGAQKFKMPVAEARPELNISDLLVDLAEGKQVLTEDLVAANYENKNYEALAAILTIQDELQESRDH